MVVAQTRLFEPRFNHAIIDDAGGSKADENIEHDQKFDMVAQYLDDLPEDQLNLLKMNFFEEKSHGEIAELTKIPLGTVKSRIRLALEKIRGKLEQDGTMANLNGTNESNMVN